MEQKNGQNKSEISLEELIKFRDFNFSHNSAEEFLILKGLHFRCYSPLFLSAAYIDAKNADEKIYQTELKLAKKALEKGCKYVTNIDYCNSCIAATGLKPK